MANCQIIINGNHVKLSAHRKYRGYRKIAEKALGRKLPENAVVHHHTSNQLVICEDQAYHLLLHYRTKAIKESGHADWLQCAYCHKFDAPENLYIQPGKNQCNYHRECRLEYKRNHYPKYRDRRSQLRRFRYLQEKRVILLSVLKLHLTSLYLMGNLS